MSQDAYKTERVNRSNSVDTIWSHQHRIIISYISLGQPGGGGRRYPESTRHKHCRSENMNLILYKCFKYIPVDCSSFQKVYGPYSKSHIILLQNSIHHLKLNISWSLVPAKKEIMNLYVKNWIYGFHNTPLEQSI